MDNKPDWKDAPEWANWLAMDENGNWFWYQYKPSEPAINTLEPQQWGSENGKWCSAKRQESINSLEKRPK